MENLGILFKQSVDRQQQAILILRTAIDFGLIQDIGRNPKGYVVVMGSGDRSFVLEGLVSSQQPDLYSVPPVKHASSFQIKMNSFVLNLLSPSMAYAGVGDFWNNLKQNWTIRSYRDNLFNQVSKNKWSYATLGVIGLALAIPTGGTSLIPLGVQLGADSYISMARSAVKAGNPQQAVKYDRYIDHVETAYNVGQVVESGYKLFTRPGKEADSIRKFTQESGGAVQRAESQAVDKIRTLAPNQQFWSGMADDAANTVANNPRWSSEVKQTVMELSDFATRRAVEVTDQVTDLTRNVDRLTETTKQGIRSFTRLVTGTERILENIVDFGDAPVDAWGGGEGLVEIGRDARDSVWPKTDSQTDIGSRFADREQRRGQQVQDRRTADELRRYEAGTRQPPVIPTTEDSQGSGETKTTGGTGTTTTTTGGTKTAGGTGTTTGGTGGTGVTTGGTQPPLPPKIPTITEGTKTTGGTTTTTVSQPSTISIRADSGHFIKINFTKGEGKSVKQETLQSGKYTETMNVILCPGFTSHVDAAVNISVDIGSDEAYYIYTTRNIWDPTVRNLVVKRGVNINGKPVNEGDLKRITSEYNLYIDIFRKGSSISRTYFRLSGTK
jgi:hypothetical protein